MTKMGIGTKTVSPYAIKQSPHRLLTAVAAACAVVLLALPGCKMPSGDDKTPPPPPPSPIGLPVEMVHIPGGTFMMGDDSSVDHDEKPEHRVTVSGFKMGKYEVTQKQYEQVMGKNPSFFQGDTWQAAGGEAQGSRPVESVSWIDAVKFCNELSRQEGKTPVYTINGESIRDVSWDKNANGYRLPTEAEWEYACRAGTDTQWSFGDDEGGMDAYGWYSGNIDMGDYPKGYGTHAVGKKEANPWGLYDMHGNVFEYCWDWWNWYDSAGNPETDPDGAASGGSRVARGGSWFNSASDARSALRIDYYGGGNYIIGFRLVCP